MFKLASHVNQAFQRSGHTLLVKSDSFLSGVYAPLINQCRTTVILRRKNKVKLLKKGVDSYVPHKDRYKIYEVEEITDFKKEAEMEVCLRQFVAGLGEKGDIVKVKRSTAYNELLVPGIAEYVTPETLSKAKNKEIVPKDQAVRFSSIDVPRTMAFLKNCILAVTMNKENSWTIEPWHIKVAFRKAGIHVKDESCIEMPKDKIVGPDMNLERKEFFVTVTINDKEKVKVRCRIHHWSTDLANRLPIEPLHWTLPAEPLFSDDKEELAAMTLPPNPVKNQEL